MNTTNTQGQDARIDALELPRGIEGYNKFTMQAYVTYTVEHMRAFARKAVAQERARAEVALLAGIEIGDPRVEILARAACEWQGIDPNQVLQAKPLKTAWMRHDIQAQRLLEQLAAVEQSKPVVPLAEIEEMNAACEKIDRYLRNNLDDADYAEFSDALEILWCGWQSKSVSGGVAEPVAPSQSAAGFVLVPMPDGIYAVPTSQSADPRVDDLAVIVRRLVRVIREAMPDKGISSGAMDYLKRQGLHGSPIRDATKGGAA